MKHHDLDGVRPLISHLERLRGVGHIVIERAADQLLNCLVIVGVTKLSDMRS